MPLLAVAPCLFILAQFAEESTDVINQELWLLESCEVPTPWHVMPITDVVTALGPLTRHDEVFLARKHSDARGRLDSLPESKWVGCWVVSLFVVPAHGSVDRFRYPVEGDGRQQFILCEPAFDVAMAIAPSAKLFDNPGGEARRRISETVRESLGTSGLYLCVCALLLLPASDALQVISFSSRQLGVWRKGLWPIQVDRSDMDADNHIRVEPAERARHSGANIRTVGTEAAVA